jgi:hypothetical protein
MQLQRSRTDVARSLVGATGQVSPGARCSPWRKLHQSLGNHRIQRLLQAKLGVSHPDDIYERQVHRVADEVMRMPEPAGLWAAFGSSSAPARIQRLCAECEEGLQRQMPMEEEQPLVQGKREDAGLEQGAAAIEPYVDGLAARGEPIAPATRAFFEPRFAADFSAVRIHTGPEADRSAAAIDALAYTAGDHIVFRAGRYDPTSLQGKHLLAHELTHVIQQGGATGALCSTCEDEDKKALQTKSAGPERPIAGVPSIVHEVLRSPGQPLEPAMRTFMEARSGHDFGRVRVHTDSRANASASAVAARAYTVGHHVVFGEGQFAPGTAEGRRLIAHELMHVMQQRESTVGLSPKLTIAPPGDAFEQEADRFADAVAGGTPNILDTQLPVVVAFSSHPSAAFTLQRQSCNPADDKIKTGALPTQLPAIECAPTPATLQQVRAVPGVPPTILGVTESGFVTDQIQFEELKASKCKAQVLHAAEPKVNFSIYVKEGDFADGTEQTPTTPPSRPCAGKVVARTLRITAEGAKKLRQGEAEHCEDAKLAFALSWGKYNQASKDLEGEYCAAGIKVSGGESICDKEFAKRFTDRTGVDWTKRQQVAKCLLDKSDLRDSNHWHDVVPVDVFYAKDCSAVTYIYGSGSAPEIGKHPPAEIVKGCGEK